MRAWRHGDIAVSAVSFWECALLYAKGRIALPKSPAAWRADMLNAGMMELPLSGDSAVLSAELEGIHRDPADRFIAASAISHRATLMTADERLLKWKHALRRQDARK
jgi:PIN domain nuclease of toxin-antitoxin system